MGLNYIIKINKNKKIIYLKIIKQENNLNFNNLENKILKNNNINNNHQLKIQINNYYLYKTK